MTEFDCCECRQHVVAIVLDVPPVPPLCATCLHLPSWHEDPELRRVFGLLSDAKPQGKPL